MGQSTDGKIVFGVTCEEEDTVFPWDSDEFEGDIDNWWKSISGYQSMHCPWTPEGGYAEGWAEGDSRFEEHYQHCHDWENNNPVPVDLDNYCSMDYPMYAIIVPGVGLSCSRGYPESFEPASLVVTEEQIAQLKEFLKKYGIEHEGEPRWLLTSYWG